ncbi:RNA-directed DNA polymerase, eukaryota, reverse transcriptase zinc-binding domain protein [Tanacetum coccineum]
MYLVLPCLISEVQSAFISNRQILDGPFILNELLSWCKIKKKRAMVFKVDFEKAFDSVKWDYLIDSLKAFNFDEVNRAASMVGCSTFNSPFKYLGVKVGDNMSRINSWEEVINNVSTRLSKWKLKTLSIGGRLTLTKSVLSSIPLYHMSIFKVSSAIHGNQGALGSCNTMSRRSHWLDIIQDLHSLKSKGIDLMQFIRKKVGNGENTSFWDENWTGDDILKNIYPRLYALEENKSISVADKLCHSSLVHTFCRLPRGGVEEVQLDSLRTRMSDVILPNMADRWI